MGEQLSAVPLSLIYNVLGLIDRPVNSCFVKAAWEKQTADVKVNTVYIKVQINYYFNIFSVMTKNIVHNSPQKWLFDLRSLYGLVQASAVKRGFVSKSLTFDPGDEIFYLILFV